LARVARDHCLAAVVIPAPRGGVLQRARRALAWARNPISRLDAPLVGAADVERLRPDVIVVASFPEWIPAGTLAHARLGALNVHMSLLPRHRGVDPLFWTYWEDDDQAGVTIHWMNERFDAGDVAAQDAIPLERGRASREVYLALASRSAELLAEILGEGAENAPRHPQDESRATYESAADIARARVPFAQWPAERVWHVLRGLGDQRSGLVVDATLGKLPHGRATSWHPTGDIDPGRLIFAGSGYELHCRDGIVAVERRG